jgi:SAM-dependent methyltransferase
MRNNILKSIQNKKINNTYIYNVIRYILKNQKQDFINLGYIDNLIYSKLTLEIDNVDLHWHRYFYMINLYLKSFERIDLAKINSALEVGSGVGGGIYLLKKYFHINRIIGIDTNKLHVLYSKFKFNRYELIFKNFSSDNFTKLKTKFDLIYSIEAFSHFQDFDIFFTNVNKSIHKNGIFLYIDLFKSEQIDEIKKINFKM